MKRCEKCDSMGGASGVINMMYVDGVRICFPCVRLILKKYIHEEV